MVWSQSATSEKVVFQKTSSDASFERVFSAAARVVATGVKTSEEDVKKVVEGFDALGLLVS